MGKQHMDMITLAKTTYKGRSWGVTQRGAQQLANAATKSDNATIIKAIDMRTKQRLARVMTKDQTNCFTSADFLLITWTNTITYICPNIIQ